MGLANRMKSLFDALSFHGRRRFLGLTAAALVGGPLIGRSAMAEAPPDVGRKFLSDGRVKTFRGNTIICHLPQQGDNAAAFGAILDIYRQAPALSFFRKITMLPPSSYHMTIFGGANDVERKPGLWPSGVPLDAPIEECDRLMGERLKAFRLQCDLPLRMMVDPSDPSDDEGPITIHLKPADETEDAKLRVLRDRLSRSLGIPAHQPDDYRFHITVAYQIDWLTNGEKEEFRQMLRLWKQDIARRSPEIVLGAPEYCTMADMFAFNRRFFLA
jgi:hypothetical protein